MTAKELKQSCELTDFDIDDNQYTWYEFSKSEMQEFIDQLCKEQRESCLHNATREADGYTAILKAPPPEL